MLNSEHCHQARLSRDARFDGLFFVAVKSTGIYCRPICPAPAAKESNVSYYPQAWEAQAAGFRPCLRCRPDASPGSPAWRGTDSSVKRAMDLIDQGALEQNSLPELAERLGIGDRYLRKLFQQQLGISPQAYCLFKRCDFAKQLLQNSQLTVTEIAHASGFGSLRQFNTQFKKYAQQTPSQLRSKRQGECSPGVIELPLAFRPPYNWEQLQSFLSRRLLSEIEWIDEKSYGRSFEWGDSRGDFTVQFQPEKNRFWLTLRLNKTDALRPIVKNIRRVLDLDANTQAIETHLQNALGTKNKLGKNLCQGLRLPGIWSAYEAGIRAIIGQQISVTAATGQLKKLIQSYGQSYPEKEGGYYLFPSPAALHENPLDALKMPGARKRTLASMGSLYLQEDCHQIDSDTWLGTKGIGPWTLSYAQMRGVSDPDILLVGDLGIKKAFDKNDTPFDSEAAAPWRSYLNMQLWSFL